MDSAKWYIDRGGKYLGPYSWERLNEMVQRGEIHPEDMLWNREENMRDRADQLAGLFSSREKDMYGRDAEVLPDYRKNRNVILTILVMGAALFLIISISVLIRSLL